MVKGVGVGGGFYYRPQDQRNLCVFKRDKKKACTPERSTAQ